MSNLTSLYLCIYLNNSTWFKSHWDKDIKQYGNTSPHGKSNGDDLVLINAANKNGGDKQPTHSMSRITTEH